jgi:hypothetical protein
LQDKELQTLLLDDCLNELATSVLNKGYFCNSACTVEALVLSKFKKDGLDAQCVDSIPFNQ